MYLYTIYIYIYITIYIFRGDFLPWALFITTSRSHGMIIPASFRWISARIPGMFLCASFAGESSETDFHDSFITEWFLGWFDAFLGWFDDFSWFHSPWDDSFHDFHGYISWSLALYKSRDSTNVPTDSAERPMPRTDSQEMGYNSTDTSGSWERIVRAFRCSFNAESWGSERIWAQWVWVKIGSP